MPPRTLGSLSILLVEDDADSLHLLSRLLRTEGHEVLPAPTAREALRLAAGGGSIDLVVSDLGLPDQSGLDLMRELRARFGLPGIALSGFTSEEDQAESAQAGFLMHLKKPVLFESLQLAIARVQTRSRPPGLPPDATSFGAYA